MNIESHVSPNGIYLLKEGLNYQQLSAAVNRCLCQAEALAVIANFIDVETVNSDTIDHYLWALSYLLQETRFLYGHLMDQQDSS